MTPAKIFEPVITEIRKTTPLSATEKNVEEGKDFQEDKP